MQAQPNQLPDKLENISKVKLLSNQLREVLSEMLKTAAHNIHANFLSDTGSGSFKTIDSQIPRFDKSFEEFNAVCDQIEHNLKTAMECYQQGSSSQRYLQLPVIPTRTEPGPNPDNSSLNYPQYLNIVRSQISYLKEIHDLLLDASQNINPSD